MRVATTITGYSGSRNRRAYTTRSIPIEHARAQVVRATRRQPVCESSRRVGRLRGHRLAGARTRTHSRHNDHLWRATGRGSAAGPPRPRHQPAFDSAEANPRDTQTLRDFLMVGWDFLGQRTCRGGAWVTPEHSRVGARRLLGNISARVPSHGDASPGTCTHERRSESTLYPLTRVPVVRDVDALLREQRADLEHLGLNVAFAAAAGGGGTKPAGRRATVAASNVGDLEDD